MAEVMLPMFASILDPPIVLIKRVLFLVTRPLSSLYLLKWVSDVLKLKAVLLSIQNLLLHLP